MVISKSTTVKWNSKNKKHYESRGYKYTKMGEPFEVAIADLTRSSTAIITLICDYCGKTYTTTWDKYNCVTSRTRIKKDCCMDCCQQKSQETICDKYGSRSEMHQQTDAKRSETNIKKYGASCVFASADIQQRIIQTNLRRYGVPYTQQNRAVRERTVATCRARYGVDNYVELYKGKYIKENSPCWKGGVEHSRVERATYEYNEWRKVVYARDRYTCQRCGAKNGDGRYVKLNAHHIVNWKSAEQLRYDPNNGITLCFDCHTEFHSLYGKKDNTQLQIDAFLNPDKKIC